MVTIPENQNTTLALIEKVTADNQSTGFREHLGASLIGEECPRKLWYTFRWAQVVKFSPRILRLFARGQREEDVFINLLKSANCDVWSVNPQTSEQWRIAWLGGHFGGSLDGVGKGIIEAPKAPHILEFKTHNDKSFKELKKKGVQVAKPLHWAQMQTYMHGSKQLGSKQIERAYYLSVNKNDDELYAERVKYDREQAEMLLQKAERIITATVPLARISDRPNWYVCQFCVYSDICHYNQVASTSCRTCIHSTPDIELGGWNCIEQLKTLDYSDQISACEKHLYIPELIPFATLEDSDGKTYAKYKVNQNEFSNIIENKVNPIKASEYQFTSKELYNLDSKLIFDDTLNELRKNFDGKVVSKND